VRSGAGRFRGQCSFRTVDDDRRQRLEDAHRRPGGRAWCRSRRAGHGRDPHERAVAGEAERRLRRTEQLPRMQREVFLLRAQQGSSTRDCRALGTTPGAARVHYTMRKR